MAQFDPEALTTSERYKFLSGAVVPRPIAWVSTQSLAGHTNLAPYSFFNATGYSPMTVMFCPQHTSGKPEKDTLRNAKPIVEGGTGEFVLNIATEPLVRAVAASAEGLPEGESEFDLTGLEMAGSILVKPPRVALSPVSFECRTVRVIRDIVPGEENSGVVIFGRVVWIHVDDAVLNDKFHLDPDRMRVVGRMAGVGYVTTRDRVDVPSGRAALGLPDPFA